MFRPGGADASACAISPFEGVFALQRSDVGGRGRGADGKMLRDFVQRRRNAVLPDEVADERHDFELFSGNSFHDAGEGCVWKADWGGFHRVLVGLSKIASDDDTIQQIVKVFKFQGERFLNLFSIHADKYPVFPA